MTWLGWLVIGIFAFDVLHTIWKVNRPRKMFSSSDAVLTTMLGAAVIIGILTIGTGSLR